MKIIKKGKKPKETKKEYRVECNECNTIFIFEEKEGIVTWANHMMIECPVCGNCESVSIYDYIQK